MKLHTRTFKTPEKNFVITQTEEGEPKYVPKTINGLPLYDAEGNMIMVPQTKMEPNTLILWLKTEYPNSATEFIRHTEPPKMTDDGKVYYFPEVFECRIWLNGRSDEKAPDANGFSSRDNLLDAEFDPLASARTSAFTNAMRMLGFGVDINQEETYQSLDTAIEKIKIGKKGVDPSIVHLHEIESGMYIEVGRNQEKYEEAVINKLAEDAKEEISALREQMTMDNLSESAKTDENSEKAKEISEGAEKSDKSDKSDKTEEAPKVKRGPGRPRKKAANDDEKVVVKRKPGRPPKKKTEENVSEENTSEKAPESAQNEEAETNEAVVEKEEKTPEKANIFDSNPELKEIAGEKFEVLENAPENLKKMNGVTFGDLYEKNFAVLKALCREGSLIKDKVPPHILEKAKKFIEVKNGQN